ncbi:MAG: hypothetical protein WCK90_03690 [archaeon]
MNCKYCQSNYVINDGFVKRRIGSIQRYKCNDCGKNFTEKKLSNKQYPAHVILSSLTMYNRGLNLHETSKEINRRFHVNVYPQLISNWLKEYGEICSYQRIRKEALIDYDFADILFTRILNHKQIYEFAYHKFKVGKFINKYFQTLREYFERVDKDCPNELFNAENARASQINLRVIPKVYETENYACFLADLALKANRDNKKRHQEIQEFMLCNDSSTLAVEVPVWAYPEEFAKFSIFTGIDKAITGHVDIIQQRYGVMYILDYKPEAEKENPISQLFFYAFALSIRTGIWLRNFRCAWFNEKGYYEFNPGDIILNSENLDDNERRKYVLDYDQQLFHEKRMFKELGSRQAGKSTGNPAGQDNGNRWNLGDLK